MIKAFFNENPRLAIGGVVGLVVFLALFNRAFMGDVQSEPLSRDQATERALEFASAEGWNAEDRFATTVPIEGDELRMARAEQSTDPARLKVNPAWETWIATSPQSILGAISTRSLPSPMVSISVTSTGDVVQYIEATAPIAAQPLLYLKNPRTIPLTELSNDELFDARPEDCTQATNDDRVRSVEIAREFFQRHGIETEGDPTDLAVIDSNRLRRVFLTWEYPSAVAGHRLTTRVIVANDRVSAYDRDLGTLSTVERESLGQTVVDQVLNSLFGVYYLVLLVIAVVLVVLKRRQGEIDLRATLTIFIAFSALNLLSTATVVPFMIAFLGTLVGNSVLWLAYVQILFQILFMTAFSGLVLAGLWSAGEGQAYLTWPRHLIRPFSAALRGRLRSPEILPPVLAGYSAAFLGLGSIAVAGLFAPDHKIPSIGPIVALMYWPAALSPVIQSITAALGVTVISGLFIMSYVRKWTKKTWVLLAAGTASTILARPLTSFEFVFPKGTGSAVLVSICLAFGLSIVMAKYGPLGMFIAAFAYQTMLLAYPLTLTGNVAHAMAGAWAMAIMLIPAGLAVYGALYPSEHATGTIPLHVQRALERLRIDQEFTVARQVQARLLPAAAPVVQGLDIAGVCVPANEVGGDYFDYFVLSDDKFGIAIGDVSGKGVGAAIYMTLTKSYMVTQTLVRRDPVRVLSRVNDHLRRNLARGTFVTMTYGVIDTTTRTLSYSRAGHNPALLVHASGEGDFLNAPGVALGATGSQMFQMATRVETVDLAAGDLIVFYTDGITEAMNLRSDEYGEERLSALIVSLARTQASAAQVVDAMLRDVRSFVGRAPQRDDITIVTVRVGG